MSLSTWFEREFLPRHLSGFAPGTIQIYRYLLRHFRKFLGQPPSLADFSDANLLGYCRWRLTHGGNQTTVVVEFSRLKAMWEWAARHHQLPEFPDIRCPVKALVRTPTAWRPEQVTRLIAGCATIKTRIAGIPGADWWHCLLAIALDTAIRKGALLRLRWSDADLEAGMILARAEDAKTARDELHQIAPDTVAALRRILEPARSLVFPWDRDESTYSRQYGRILRAAGLPGGNRNQTHKMRRTSATWVAQLGGLEAARAHLGHASAAMTLAHYVDQSQMPATNWAARFPRP